MGNLSYLYFEIGGLSVYFICFVRLLLSKETFHRFNRIALLGILFLSLLIPYRGDYCSSDRIESDRTDSWATIDDGGSYGSRGGVGCTAGGTFHFWVQVLLLFYLVGIIFFACRNLYSLSVYYYWIKSGKRERLKGGVRLIVLERGRSLLSVGWDISLFPGKIWKRMDARFWFMKWHIFRIVIPSICLVADICIFFQWFNPGIWLLKQELQNIHEYEADETVINEGIDAKDYQLLIKSRWHKALLYGQQL